MLPALRMMSRAMRHRGPDDEGLVIANVAGELSILGGPDTPETVYESRIAYTPSHHAPEDGDRPLQVGLVHRRLSIVDLSPAGHQPLLSENGQLIIVYNGEIYNFRELREQLKAEGANFRSGTDTEVVLEAYARWGPDCVQRFNGMWAFAIWDRQARRLFCSRDRIGIKPFYYAALPNAFVFASDIKALLASKLVTPEVNLEGLFHAMTFQCAPRPMTCFAGITALRQAHSMTVDDSTDFRETRYWSLPDPACIDDERSESSWVQDVDECLRDSVATRLLADVPVGTFMSGGIDSTTVTAMSAMSHPGIKAFTLDFEEVDSEFLETAQAEATARRYDLQHIIKKCKAIELIEGLDDVVECLEEPSPSLPPNYLISKQVAEEGVKVILNGLGGDELFCGYGRERMFRRWQQVRPYAAVLRWLPGIGRRLSKARYLSQLRDPVECYVAAHSFFREDQKRDLFGDVTSRQWDTASVFRDQHHLAGLSSDDVIRAICVCDLLGYVGNHHVYRIDQFTMHFSLEGRIPFLDHRLVELAFRMPSRYKVRDGVGKYVLRNVAKDYIDPSCLSMKKKGFNLPIARWLQSSLRQLATEAINDLQKREMFNNRAITRLQNEFNAGARPYQQLWFLVATELWLKRFIDS